MLVLWIITVDDGQWWSSLTRVNSKYSHTQLKPAVTETIIKIVDKGGSWSLVFTSGI